MISHPTADELLAGVGGFIEKISPQLKDRDAFLARVAVNALAAVRRELAAGAAAERRAMDGMRALLQQDGDFEALNGALCAAIREGRFDGDEARLLSLLRASAIDRVRIDQPGYSGLKVALAPGG